MKKIFYLVAFAAMIILLSSQIKGLGNKAVENVEKSLQNEILFELPSADAFRID